MNKHDLKQPQMKSVSVPAVQDRLELGPLARRAMAAKLRKAPLPVKPPGQSSHQLSVVVTELEQLQKLLNQD